MGSIDVKVGGAPISMEQPPVVMATGLGACEGPVLRASGGLLVSSMSQACVWEILDGGPKMFASTGGGGNGLTEGAHGRIYVTQMGPHYHIKRENWLTGGIQVISADGSSVSWLTQDAVGPNDLCFGPDGLLYFTDPTRASRGTWNDGRIWRVDPESGETQLLASLDWYPNGIGFSHEDDALYVAAVTRRQIVRFPLTGSGVGTPETFAPLPYGHPDGFAFDVDGNLVVCAVHLGENPGELQVFNREGELVDRRRLGSSHLYTNVAIDSQGTAFVTDTAGGEVLRVDGWARPGLPLHPFRV